MLQTAEPGVFVLATGKNATVREFVTLAAKAANIGVTWQGRGEQEHGIDAATGKLIVSINPKFYRPAEVETLVGCAARAKKELGWEAKTTLEELCRMMVDADLARVASGHALF